MNAGLTGQVFCDLPFFIFVNEWNQGSFWLPLPVPTPERFR
jgi:hypothetical protein